MKQPDILDFIYYPLALLALGLWAFFQIRYLIGRYRRKRWPILDATMQKGAVGRVVIERASIPASFVGYSYTVQQVRYAGCFALCGGETQVRRLHDSLAGTSIRIRYDPLDPNTSFLVDYHDSRFDGLTATQSPDKLNQAPAFDLQDAIRGSSVGKESP
jgi:hypothetical protein